MHQRLACAKLNVELVMCGLNSLRVMNEVRKLLGDLAEMVETCEETVLYLNCLEFDRNFLVSLIAKL